MIVFTLIITFLSGSTGVIPVDAPNQRTRFERIWDAQHGLPDIHLMHVYVNELGYVVVEDSSRHQFWFNGSRFFQYADSTLDVPPLENPVTFSDSLFRDRSTFLDIAIDPEGSAWGITDHHELYQVYDGRFSNSTPTIPNIVIEHVSSLFNNYAFPKDKLTLASSEREIDIEFASLSFINPSKNDYRYRLFGHDTKWHEGSALNRATYRFKKPGEYTFKVMGSNAMGDWNVRGATLTISVEPYFYETELFTALIILFLLMNVCIVGYLVLGATKREEDRKNDLNRLEGSFERVDLISLIRSCVTDLKKEGVLGSTLVEFRANSGSMPLHLNRRVMINVLKGLIKATNDLNQETSIRMQLIEEHSVCTLKIKTYGESLSQGELNVIHDQQVDKKEDLHSETIRSVLAIIPSIQQHNATLVVHSIPGKGTTWSLVLKKGRYHLLRPAGDDEIAYS
ncbi:MAG: triple tyrosine motif-containing protein [Bacteroidota bacterium]